MADIADIDDARGRPIAAAPHERAMTVAHAQGRMVPAAHVDGAFGLWAAESRTCWLSGTTGRGLGAMRISVCSWATTSEDVERSIEAILRAASDA